MMADLKIYFGFTVAGDRSSLPEARQVVALMEELGHEVLTRHLVEDDAGERDRSLGAREVFERDMRWLEECDVFVAEVSGSSFGLGYEAGVVLAGSARKAVLCYRAEAAARISLLITGNTHPNCVLMPYAETDALVAALRVHLG